MANCPSCGSELINGSIFCGVCGSRVPDGLFESSDITLDYSDLHNSAVNSIDIDFNGTNDSTNVDQPMLQGQPIGGTGKASSVMVVDGQKYQAYVPERAKINGEDSVNDSVNDSVSSSYNDEFSSDWGNTTTSNSAYNTSTNYNSNQTQQGKTNSFCLIGFILGIVSVLSCGMLCGITEIAGIIVSIIGIKQADNNNEGGKGLGIAGLSINVVMTFIFVMIIIFLMLVQNF